VSKPALGLLRYEGPCGFTVGAANDP